MFNFGTQSFGGRFAQIFAPSWVVPDTKKEQDDLRLQQQALQVLDPESGAQIIDNGTFNSPTLAVETSYQNSAALVNEYRAMALDPDVDMAVDDIVNAAIVTQEDEQAIMMNLEDVEDLSEALKEEIIEEFNYILGLMDIEETGYEKFRSWYVDGRQYFQLVVDPDNTKEGIQRLVQLDPRAMKKIKEVNRRIDPTTRIETVQAVDDYYMYNPAWLIDQTAGASIAAPGLASPNAVAGRLGPSQVLKIPTEMIAFVHSGIMSQDGSMVFSHLEKARKPLNNLKMLRDALVIYWITRAPERRVFYIDVGSLPKKAAAEYVTEYMNKNRTKVTYDPTSGKVNGHAYQQTMLQDFWMPRREGGRGTEVDTLQGGDGLGDIEELLYFQKLLFRALNVPMGRMEGDDNASLILGGSGAEMTRDELKFYKFVQRLRRRYCSLFKDILRVHLSLKGICTKDEWDEIANKVRFTFASDSHLKEQQENQNMINMLGALSQADPFVGKYFPRDWVKRNIMKQDDEEIERLRDLMDKEREDDLDNDFNRELKMGSVNNILNPEPDLDFDGTPKTPSSGTGAIQPNKPSGGKKAK